MNIKESWRSLEGCLIGGQFPLRQWLGDSDHSAVFLTEWSGHAPSGVAIKLMFGPNEGGDPLARWRLAARLSHPHLLGILETGSSELDGKPLNYCVMELADDDLAQILPQRPLTPAEVTEMLPPLLDALDYLHKSGFVHGRIQPSNVLAVGDQLKLSTDPVISLDQSGSAKRRDVYDPPEAAAGVVSPAGDLWSVGVTLVAALTQNVSFATDSWRDDPNLAEKIPEPFRGIVRDCLQLDPARRCSIADIQSQLHPAAPSAPTPPERAATPAAGAPSPYRYTWRMLIPAAVLLLFALGWRFFHKPLPPAVTEGSGDTKITVTAPSKPESPPPFTAAPEKPASTPTGVVRQVLPDIPQSARNTITGTIKIAVRVEVDAGGGVSSARLTASGPSKYFANLTLKAAQGWEFAPPVTDGQPVPSVWMLRFRLKRSGIQVTPERMKR